MSDVATFGLGIGFREFLLNVRADEYLQKISTREQVDTSQESPVRKVQAVLTPSISLWANGNLLSLHPSGSFIKGTAYRSVTDIDLLSLEEMRKISSAASAAREAPYWENTVQ